MLICPKQPYVLVADEDPSLRLPRPCGSYKCPCCRPAKVNERLRVVSWALRLAGWKTFITLTQLPGDWQKARGQIRDWIRRVRKRDHVEIAWAIEENPKATGYHAHLLQWGDYLDVERLRAMWGGRWLYIEPLKEDNADYLTKVAKAVGYVAKNIVDHLAVNGGRAIHYSRGFLHGMTARGVLKLMSTKRTWHLEHATADEMADLTPRKWEEVDTMTNDVYTVDASTKSEVAANN